MSALHWLAPWSLVTLLPLGGIIILLYLLRLRRREVTIPSTFLWRRAVQDVQANVPFQRLRRNLLLLLQLLALLLLVLALASPYLLSRRACGHDVILILDTSASMKATDLPGSRFEEARRQAQVLVKGLGRNDEVAVLVCDANPRVALPFSRDRRKLVALLGSLQATDCSTNVRDGLLLAASLASRRKDVSTYLFSDGAFPPLPAVALTNQFHYVCLGKRQANVALLAFEASRPEGKREHELFVRLRNFSTQAQSVVLTLSHEDEILKAERLSLKPEENRVLSYAALLQNPGLLKAEIEVRDDLQADNVAYAVAEAESLTSVLLVTPGNLFLEQGLLVVPDVSLYKAAALSTSELQGALGKYDVVVLDRVPLPEEQATGGLLVFGAAGGTGKLATPTISEWEQKHPVLANVDLTGLQIAQAQGLALATGSRAIVSAGSVPLMISRETPGARAIVCGFNLLDTDWPLRVGFPIFLSNTVHWLAGASARGRLSAGRPGMVLRAMVPGEASQVTLVLPDGGKRTVATQAGELSFSGATETGVYSARLGGVTKRWALDLRDAAESDTTPHEDIKLGEQRVVSGSKEPQREQHLWPWLVLVALAVLLGEWHLYHRRL